MGKWKKTCAYLISAFMLGSGLLISTPEVQAATTLVGQWSFNEGNGKVTKEQVSQTNDTINYVFNQAVYKPSTDPEWRNDGISGKALLFDGYSTWVTHPAITTPQSQISIEAWVAPRAYEWGDGNKLEAIVNQQNKDAKQGFILGIDRHGTWSFQFGSNNNWYEVWSFEPLPKYEWSYLTATYDSQTGKMVLYVNGKQVSSNMAPVHSLLTPASTDLLIGKNNQSTNLGVFPLNMFNGLIDEIKVSNGTLSPIEVENAYNAYMAALGGNLPTPDLKFDRSVYNGDTYRPTYHAIAPQHWQNEPHAPLFFNGQYHLFYQFNQHGPYWHNMHWGHWVSTDMVHWRDLPPALSPGLFQVDPDGDCFTM
ncbi:LamG domain-containing protein [Paenibacillus hexagrammi]|uniref:LamG-like jellyroll fold domain-containing protein n=1 Tax=Paenibacillus hexagrammi TaxID=2908839 RepID=A0ABY3SEH3_9BACL|nr:LamG domain-containing protein [Paenibacillus sp. YPD9-1]UJF32392.1 hypothetical protein L0M14_22230 [Paenibacillus sp. YPD9-1]